MKTQEPEKKDLRICKRLNEEINYPKFCIEEYYNDGRVGGLFCECYDFLNKKCLYGATTYKEGRVPEKKEEISWCSYCHCKTKTTNEKCIVCGKYKIFKTNTNKGTSKELESEKRIGNCKTFKENRCIWVTCNLEKAKKCLEYESTEKKEEKCKNPKCKNGFIYPKQTSGTGIGITARKCPDCNKEPAGKKVKNCPRCDSSYFIFVMYNKWGYRIENRKKADGFQFICQNKECQYHGVLCSTKENAIKTWNEFKVKTEPKEPVETICKYENDCCKYPGCIENDCTGFEPVKSEEKSNHRYDCIYSENNKPTGVPCSIESICEGCIKYKPVKNDEDLFSGLQKIEDLLEEMMCKQKCRHVESPKEVCHKECRCYEFEVILCEMKKGE